MKKIIRNNVIKIIRNIIYAILCCTRFPFIKSHFQEFLDIKKNYENKPVMPILNRRFNIQNHLTIIVPTYNGEKTIDKCLFSLTNQKTDYSYNIVVVNDGSTDGTNDILEKYKRKHENILIINQENQGIAEARNRGLSYVTGEYIAFVDSDDFVSEMYVEKLLNNAYETGADIVRCNYYEYDIEKQKYIKKGKDQENIVLNKGIKDRILDFKGYPWGGVYKSALWENIQFPNGYWYEDMIIRMIVFRKAKMFSYINDTIYYYCLHENNISKLIEKTTSIQCLDHFFLIKRLCQLSNDIGLLNDYSLRINILYEYSVVLWLRTRKLNKSLRKTVFQEACQIIESMFIYQENLTNEQRLVVSIMKKKDYIRWQLYAIYKMLAVKYGV